MRIPPGLGQNTDKPSDNQAAPMTQRNKETPTEPVAAKIPEGVEKTEQFFLTRISKNGVVVKQRTTGANHLVQNQENCASNPQLLVVIDVDNNLILDGGGGRVVGTFVIRLEIGTGELEIAG